MSEDLCRQPTPVLTEEKRPVTDATEETPQTAPTGSKVVGNLRLVTSSSRAVESSSSSPNSRRDTATAPSMDDDSGTETDDAFASCSPGNANSNDKTIDQSGCVSNGITRRFKGKTSAVASSGSKPPQLSGESTPEICTDGPQIAETVTNPANLSPISKYVGPNTGAQGVDAPSGVLDGANKAWSSYLKFNDSIITDIFAGLLQSTVECKTCHHQ
jgi:hypothetical protein